MKFLEIYHQLYQFLESRNLESAESLIQSNNNIFTCFDSNNVYTLMLRYNLYCDNLESKKRISTIKFLNIVLEILLKWFAPVLSFTTEEIYSLLKIKNV